MAVPNKQESAGLWFIRRDIAELCGVSPRTFDDTIRPLIPEASIQGAGAKLRYHGPGAVAALLALRLKKPPEEPKADAENTPNMELIRHHKATLAEMDVLERRRELVKVETVKQSLATGIVALRGGGDRIARQCGAVAAEIFNESVNEFEAAALAAFKNG